MYRDIKDFAKTFSTDAKSTKDTKETPKSNQNTGDYQKIIDQYKDMDNTELMKELYSQASRMKENGQLNSDTIAKLESTLGPMLSTEQSTTLHSILKSLL